MTLESLGKLPLLADCWPTDESGAATKVSHTWHMDKTLYKYRCNDSTS